MRKILLLLVIITVSIPIIAQEECAFMLEEAQEMFDAGLIETIPEKLAGCLDKGFTPEEKLSAYKLVILSYLFDDNMIEADRMMLEFLSDFPAYEPVATDPREFLLLKETYDTRPVLMVGGSLGPNFSFPLVTDPFGVYNNDVHRSNYVPGRSGFHGNVYVQRRIRPNIVFTGGVEFANNVFDCYLDDERDVISPSAEITDFSVIEFYETQNRLSIPLMLSYNFLDQDFRPYISIGMSPGFLLGASGEAKRDYTVSEAPDPKEVANIKLLPIRHMFNVAMFAGGGFSYKLGPGNFFMDLKLNLQLRNQVKTDAEADRYMFDELTFGILYVNDDFLLSNTAISVGYMLPIYRPKKKAE